MHGTVQLEGESFRSLRRSSSQHMRSVHPLATSNSNVTVVGDHHSSPATSIITTVTSDSFLKDGRKICVGDCALFKPPQDSPPFIGVIHRLTLNKENNLQLAVNWLYRPAELNLGKGIVVEGAPNEIFYSFHKDEISAASLLHPCKVAFLPPGVELPSRTSSLVCRRVYDIANKCLWWLTDQDYINEQQEEVDQLLYKTRTEMHAKLQPGGRSPKQVNGPSSTSQLKPASGFGQNSGTNLHSQVKGKKRERGDHTVDPVKRERSVRADDGDSSQCKTENNLKSEIARITDKGGVIDLEGVEKLVQLMQQERMERKMDLVSRSMLAGVMAATNKVDCLNRFMQLRGIPVLDEWLQDLQKVKTGDGNNYKESDKSLEEFLLVLLRALDKLPVNLHTLQMCNIGRSVNHLRSHKNLEVQRKARGLVDTWKKRVEAEMNSIDAKSGSTQAVSWPSKSRLSEASHGGSRTPSGSDIAMKSSVTHNSAKTTSVMSSHGESNVKSATSSPGPVKSASSPSSVKESQPSTCVGGTADVPHVREDRSSSSNQSQSYSQSSSGKEDGKITARHSVSVNKMPSTSTRKRKISGFSGTSTTGSQKEINSSRNSSAHKSIALEKFSQSGLSNETVLTGSITDGSSHKLIVKIPNRVQSPAEDVGGGSLEDSPHLSSRVFPAWFSDKHEQFERTSGDKSDIYHCNAASDMNVESLKSSKDVLTGCVRVAGSPSPTEDVGGGSLEDSTHLGSRVSPAWFSDKHEKFERTSGDKSDTYRCNATSDMNVESLKSSKDVLTGYVRVAGSSSPAEDVGGGSLEDSTLSDKHEQFERTSGDKSDTYCCNAASDMNAESLKSSKDVLTPAAVPDEERSMTIEAPPTNHFKSGKLLASSFSPMNALVESCAKYSEANTSLSLEDDVGMNLLASVAAGEMSRSDLVSPTDSTERSTPAVEQVCNDDEAKSKSFPEGNVAGVQHQSCYGVESSDRKQDLSQASEDFTAGDGSKHVNSSSTDVRRSVDHKREVCDKSNDKTDTTSSTPPISKEKVKDGELNEEILEEKASPGNVSTNGASICKSCGTDDIVTEEKASTAEAAESNQPCEGDCQKDADEGLNMGTTNSLQKSTFDVMKSELVEGANNEKLQESVEGCDSVGKAGCEIKVGELDEKDAKCCLSKSERLNFDMEVDTNAACEDRGMEESNLENKDILKCPDSKSASIQPDETEECVSAVAEASSSATGTFYADTKMEFDLNEGFDADEGKYVDPVNLMSSGATTLHMINALPLSMNSIPSSYSGSITVAAAAKGPFVPPEDLLRSKGELGWKGSAATSAFRPAEPRKVLETPDSSTSRHGRMPLDIDLNVPDERLLEEMASRDSALAVDSSTDFASSVRSSSRLDLDLNRIDEANDNGNCSTSTNRKGDGSFMYVKSLGGLPTGEASRDFDLNDGPCVDDVSAEQFLTSQQVPAGIPSQLPTSGLRINNPGLGNFSSWFSPGNTYSTVAIPSMLPDRPEHTFSVFPPNAPQRTFGPSGVTQFTPDLYRGSVLSSSPAMPFPSSPFQFPVFPFGTTFPVGTTSYADASSGPRLFAPPVHPHLLGPVGSVTSQFQRPFLVGLPDSNNNGGFDNNRRWGRQGLDLNAGPGAMETDVREEMLHRSSSQHSAANSQALAEDQARRYSVSGGILKRKEPEGGWENESFRSKQSSWQ